MRLRYKFFLALLTTSFLILVLLICVMQLFVYRNFADFVNRTELAKLEALTTNLTSEYKKNNNWETFRNDPRYFIRILEKSLPFKNGNRHRPPHLDPDFRREHEPAGKRFERRSDRRRGFRPPPHPDPINPGTRLCLFDVDKEYIAGPLKPGDRFTYEKISLNDETIGWLGLKLRSDVRHPLEESFFKAQKKAFFILGGGIFILAIIISYLLSRHLLAPIKELVKGTKAMSSFDFDTIITVNTKDELGRLADDFNHMAATLKQYEKIRKNWISDISHELRTPISILKGKVESFQDGVREVTPAALASLNNDIKRLEKLVEDLHLLSLADSASIFIQKNRVKPLNILKTTLESFQLRLEKQSIQVQADLSVNPDFYFSASKEHLERLFSNIIENTLRYTDSPGVLIIKYNITPKWFELTFEDSSPGVPEKSIELIFNRLYREDKSRNRAHGGSGLGLSICRQIVENHNGTIKSGHSELGGLKLTIELPF